MRKNQRKVLDESLAWIREHPHATNLDVPDELMYQWIFEDDDEEQKPNGFYLSIFSFGYLQGEIVNSLHPIGHLHTVSMNRLLECFDLWQMKLGLVELHRKTEIKVAPLPLFVFPDREVIRFWPSGGNDQTGS